VKSVNLVVADDEFLSQCIFFIVVTLITKELFEQLLIRTDDNWGKQHHLSCVPVMIISTKKVNKQVH